MTYIRRLTLLLSLALITNSLWAANRYWVAAATGNWNDTNNWSTTTGGAGGASVPGSNDKACFDGNGLGKCVVDIDVNVKQLLITSGFTDSLDLDSSKFVIGTVGATLSGGTILGGVDSIICAGNFTISGATFISTQGVLALKKHYTISSGSFSHNYGSVVFQNHDINIIGTQTLFGVVFDASDTNRTYTIDSVVTIEGYLVTTGSNKLTIDGDSLEIRGDVSIENTYAGGGEGTSVWKIIGNQEQRITGTGTKLEGKLPTIVINKDSAILFLWLADSITRLQRSLGI